MWYAIPSSPLHCAAAVILFCFIFILLQQLEVIFAVAAVMAIISFVIVTIIVIMIVFLQPLSADPLPPYSFPESKELARDEILIVQARYMACNKMHSMSMRSDLNRLISKYHQSQGTAVLLTGYNIKKEIRWVVIRRGLEAKLVKIVLGKVTAPEDTGTITMSAQGTEGYESASQFPHPKYTVFPPAPKSSTLSYIMNME